MQGYYLLFPTHMQWARPRSSLESSSFASVFSTNGSSIEEILKELDVRYVFVVIIVHSSSLINAPADHGYRLLAVTFLKVLLDRGSGGGSFNELLDNCGAVVRRIVLRSGSLIDAIQVTYRFSNGQDSTGSIYIWWNWRREAHDVDGGERLIGVFGKSGSRV